MRDHHSLVYNYPVTSSSDDTIYLSATSLPKTSSGHSGEASSPVHHQHAAAAMCRQASKIADHQYNLAQQQQQYLHSSNSSSSSSKSQHHHHRRSASLLGRLRHPATMSPTSSPTSSSESSSRDTHSERTLAHSASSGSMRHNNNTTTNQHYSNRPPPSHQYHYQVEDTVYHHESQRPSVRVLPPPQHDDSSAAGSDGPGNDRGGGGRRSGGKKRNNSQSKSNGKSTGGGFISQLLRGGGGGPSSKSRSPSSVTPTTRTKSSTTTTTSGLAQFVRSSPGLPQRTHVSPNVSVAGRKSPSAFSDLDSEIVMTERHFTSPHLLPPPPPRHHAYLSDQSISDDYMGPPPPPPLTVSSSQSVPNYTPAAYFAGSHHYHVNHADHHHHHHRQAEGCSPTNNSMRDDDSQSSGLANERGGTISGAWFDAGNRVSGAAADHLMSALPVYEPIDMTRAIASSSSSSSSPPSSALGGAQTSSSSSGGGGGGLGRATQPTLPDARLLAPMASLTDVFPPGIGDYNALSNRELRFAVENHMLVEQHRYLIRDLGHARSAIAALKQVVQAKEERFESYELANVELQQRVALLESMLTPEQRQQLACMPYAFNMCSVSSSSSHQSLRSQPAAHDVPGDEGAEAPLQPPDLDEPCGGSGSGAGFALATSSAAAAAAEARRNNGRPLSGYVTGYSFNDKPVGHLPRVFSGDYSAANVQAMETSVEALANAIAAMPRDEATVEDIIASKMPEKQSGANSSASAADNDDDASPHHPQPQPPPGAAGSKAKQHSAADHPRQPKRRSRFFSALRLSSFNGAVASAAPVAGEMGNRSRRSVSLGSTQRPAAAGVADQHQQQQPATMTMTPGGYSEAEAETAASCPTLLIPGITGGQPRSATVQRTARRQASADSFGSAAGAGGGRYPASLGLASGGGGGSDKASSRRVASGVSSGVSSCEDDEPHARQPQRLSFTPQPRRSTSAPSSRPQSMRVASRRSWLLQLFGSSSSSSAGGGGEPPVTEAASAEAAAAGGLWQRRRVMTQSSTEVAQLLGALQLSGEPAGAAAHGGGGPLEDVADVSGEDEERAARPSLSVAEIRQQTLDALNGTLPRVVQPVQPPMRILSLPHAGAAAAAALGAADDDDEPPEPPAVGSRWRQRESSVPTIMRLNPPPALLPAAATASLGLGVSVARRGSLPTTALTPLAGLIAGAGSPPPSDRRSQAQSPPGGGEGGGGGAPDDAANGKRWAPAFWAPPPPPVLSPAAANHQTTWASPRDSADSFESASMASRLSDDARQQPMAARGSLSLRHRRGGSSSPWEMVRAAESRTTFSPTHSRPGTPPPPQSSARSLGFFEDSTVVPDSDELLATAARRSLSLRMSRNAFKQAEPLPEADDAPDAPSSSSSSSSSPALSMAEASSAMLAPPGTSSSPAPPRNNALARVAADAAAQPKRRSLLWQFNSKHSHPSHPPRSDCASVASSDDKTAPPSVAAAAADNDDLLLLKDTCVMTSVVTAAAAAPPKRPKKWWSAVLG